MVQAVGLFCGWKSRFALVSKRLFGNQPKKFDRLIVPPLRVRAIKLSRHTGMDAGIQAMDG